MEDINLDFLNTPPKRSGIVKDCESPYVYREIDVGFGKRKHGKKSFQMAQSIAKVDELINEIYSLKNKNSELHLQLKDFQKTAEEVQHLYNKEKKEHESIKESFDYLKKKYEKLDDEFTNNTMVTEQMKARLSEYEGRPIHFNALVVKYIKLMKKLEGDEVLKYLCEKELLEKLKEYCCNMKLKISSSNSPKKNPTLKRSKTKKTKETYVQCNLYKETHNTLNNIQCSSCVLQLAEKVEEDSTKTSGVLCDLFTGIAAKNVIMKNQSTQVSPLKKDQSSQYISTMITRQTNTDKIAQKHVQTMFPEPQIKQTIDDILNTYTKWCRIRPISPLPESPKHSSTQRVLKSFNSVGTCTMLCNIRRKIDYLPANNVANIKQEIITPSASPVPNSQRLNINRLLNTMFSNVSINTNNQSQQNSLYNLLNNASNTFSLGDLNVNAFNELWQIFGKILLSLLQTNRPGISNVNPNSTINQQQFIDWLLEIFLRSEPQTTATAQTQTSDETVALTISSPVRFNDNSMELSANIIRPQAQKSTPILENERENDNEGNLRSTDISLLHRINETNSTNRASCGEFSEIPNTLNSEIQPMSTVLNSNTYMNVFNESDLNDSYYVKEVNEKKSINNVLETVQVLTPENKLKKKKNKKKNKVLKRILQYNHFRKTVNDPVKATNYENNFEIPIKNEQHIETAVDFLKIYADFQQNKDLLDENLTKNNNMHKEKILNENRDIKSKINNNKNDFDFVKPSEISPKLSKKLTSPNRDILLMHSSTSKKPKNLRSVNHTLFGSSDSEADEIESKYDEQDERPVIKTIENLSESTSITCRNNLNSQVVYNQECKENNYIAPSASKKGKCIISVNNTQDIAVVEGSSTDLLTMTIENCSKHLPENPLTTLKQLEPTYIQKDLPLFDNHNENISNISNQASEITKPLADVIAKSYINCNESRAIDIVQYEPNNTTDSINTISEENQLVSSPVHDSNIRFLSILNNETEKSEKVTYASDFEKDFELSSDDESLIDNNEDNILIEQQDEEECEFEIPTDNENLTYRKKSVINLRTDNGTILPNNSQDVNEFENFVSSKKMSLEKEQIKRNEHIDMITNSLDGVSNLEQTNFLNMPVVSVSDSTATNSNSLNLNIETDSLTFSKTEDIQQVNESDKNCIISHDSSTTSNKSYLNDSSSTDTKLTANSNNLNLNFETDPLTSMNTEDIQQVYQDDKCCITSLYSLTPGYLNASSSTDNKLTANNSNNLNPNIETDPLTSSKTKDIQQANEGDKNCIISHDSSTTSNKSYLNDSSSTDTKLTANSNNLNLNFETDPLTSMNTEDIQQVYQDDKCCITSLYSLTPGYLNASSSTDNKLTANNSNSLNPNIETDPLTSSKTKDIQQANEGDKNCIISHDSSTTSNKSYLNDSSSTDTKLAAKSNNLNLNFETDALTPSNTEDIQQVYQDDKCCITSLDSLPQSNESYLNDSSSTDNKLLIDEDMEEGNEREFSTDNNETLNSSNISPLCKNSLYNTLAYPLKKIADDLLDEKNQNSLPLEDEAKRGRKRKSRYLSDLLPCKRSERLKAKQIIVESSLNLTNTPIEIGKYTKRLDIFPCKDKNQQETLTSTKISNADLKHKITEENGLNKNETYLQLGYFKETQLEETDRTVIQNKIIDISNLKDRSFETNIKHSKITESSLQESENTSSLHCNKSDIYKRPTNVETKDNEANLDEALIKYNYSPHSPEPVENFEKNFTPAIVTIPTKRLLQYSPENNNQTLLEKLIKLRVAKQSIINIDRKQQSTILIEIERHISIYCYNEMELNSDFFADRLINKLLDICNDYKIIYKSLITVSQKVESTQTIEKDLPSIIQEMPPRHLSKCMQRLFAVIRHFSVRNPCFCLELMEQIESVLFCSKQCETLDLESSLNLTQLYLMACKVQESVGLQKNPVRLFITKCLYYYIQKAVLLIHEVLMWYPTTLPHREDKTYDRSDALITVLQYALMNTKYDVDKTDLRSKSLLSKLRYEYHFQPFTPRCEEVVNLLVDKIKNNKFCNLYLAFGLLCKRMGQQHTQNVVLLQHLLPLAQEYYTLALKTDEYDNRIANLLEIISVIIKPFPYTTDIRLYLNEFSRFLKAFERPIIQEAALCSIIRLQRFGYNQCYNLLKHFQPTFELKTHTQAMLKSFICNRWKST